MNDLPSALHNLLSLDLKAGAESLFAALGYVSDKTEELPSHDAAGFAQAFGHTFSKSALQSEWKRIDLLFQITGDELSGQLSLGDDFNRQRFESFLFFAVDLEREQYSRTELAGIARELNKPFPAPVIALFRHGTTVSLASLHRRESKKDSNRDVLDRVVLLKDIRLENPHRAHLDILRDLAGAKTRAHDWKSFLLEWNRVLDLSELNKKFYRELSNWFFAAREWVEFPDKSENATERGLIRLISRLIFTWFIKERGLVPEALFDENRIKALLKDTEGESSSYYHAVLQNLFFATLNSEMGERRFCTGEESSQSGADDNDVSCLFRYENEFKSRDQWLALVEDVPFLNGGLFECLDAGDTEDALIDGFSDDPEKQAYIRNDLFWGEKWTADLSGVYDDKKRRSVEVTPLLNLLHSYKFTVDENTPLEEDVALDPELQSKVFENLLASYNPETRTTARKQTGSFYTPREIVGYMVDEALFAYLTPTLNNSDTLRALLSEADPRDAQELGLDEATITALIHQIETLKLLDPAIGSGAFPMGALQKLVWLLKKLDPNNEKWKAVQLKAARSIQDAGSRATAIAAVEDTFEHNAADYGRKLYLIEKCIYGVDIQPIALQIAKLRFFISLIIDQTIDDSRPNRNIRALPNLETKFVCANTLISLKESKQGTLADLEANVELDQKFAELADVRRDHIAPESRTQKKWLEKEDKRLRGEIKTLMHEAGFGDSVVTPIAEWNPYDQNAVAPFFDPERMFGPELKEGFDILVGNPPYVRHESIAALKPLVKDYACYAGTADLYVYFFERSLRLLKNGGVLAFICSNKYFRAGYGAKLRAYLSTNTQMQRLIDFGDAPVFTAIAYPHIIITRKVGKSDPAITFPALSWTMGRPIEKFEEVVQTESFAMPQENLSAGGWQIERADNFVLLQKLRDAGVPLGEYVGGRFYRGVLTGLNEAFVVDRATRDALIAEDASSAALLKPFLRGRDVKRWRVNFTQHYLIQIESSENKQHAWSNFDKTEAAAAEKVFNKMYPAIHRHLNQFRDGLIKRFDKGRFFWELRACKYWDEFAAGKIIYPDIAKEQQFSFDDTGFRLVNTLYFVPSGEKFLLGVLNSKSCFYYYLSLSNQIRGGFVRYFSQSVEQIPIPTATSTEQKAISSRVEKILGSKTDATADVSVLEREIDELVADLYGLDADEKKLIGI